MVKKIKIILLVVLLILVGTFCYSFFLSKTENNKPATKAEIVDNIEAFGYILHDTDTELYKTEFKELKAILNSKEIDYDKYAESISKLFVISFYTLSDKVTNHDIGGVDFIYPDYAEMFRTKAKDGMYKYIESNVYGDRKQELPIVSNIEVVSVDNEKFKYDELLDDNAYLIELTIQYEKDLGYPKKVSIVLIKDDKKLYIVEIK